MYNEGVYTLNNNGGSYRSACSPFSHIRFGALRSIYSTFKLALFSPLFPTFTGERIFWASQTKKRKILVFLFVRVR
jgi:hypothetical protein